MKPSRLSGLVTVSALGLFIQSTGCSFAFVENAPPQAEWPRDATSLETRSPCTESTKPAFTDGAIAAGLAGLSAMAWLVSRHPGPDSEGDIPERFLTAAMLVAAVPFLISAIYGFMEIDRCREYRRGPPYDDPP